MSINTSILVQSCNELNLKPNLICLFKFLIVIKKIKVTGNRQRWAALQACLKVGHTDKLVEVYSRLILH